MYTIGNEEVYDDLLADESVKPVEKCIGGFAFSSLKEAKAWAKKVNETPERFKLREGVYKIYELEGESEVCIYDEGDLLYPGLVEPLVIKNKIIW